MRTKILSLALLSNLIFLIIGCSGRNEDYRIKYTLEPTTNESSMGIIVGKIFVVSGGVEKPADGLILYLAEIIVDEKGNASFAAFERVNSPRATTDDSGSFIFENVRPGSYGLVLDVITNSYMLMKPRTKDPIILEVSKGSVYDLGVLVYDELPIQVDD